MCEDVSSQNTPKAQFDIYIFLIHLHIFCRSTYTFWTAKANNASKDVSSFGFDSLFAHDHVQFSDCTLVQCNTHVNKMIWRKRKLKYSAPEQGG